MRTFILLAAIAGAYSLLKGWQGSPGILLRACLSVTTLVAGIFYWSRGMKTSLPRMFCLRRASWLDYLSMGAVIIFTEACFVVITSTLAAPAQELADAFHEHASYPISIGKQKPKGSSPNFDGHTSGNWLFNKSLKRNLPPFSNHKPSNKPEVFIQLENRADATRMFSSRIHLRAFAMSRFNGITWAADRTATTKLKAPITFPRNDHRRVTSKPIKHRIYHSPNPTGQNVLILLQGAVSSNVPSLSKISDAIYLLPPVSDSTSGYSYSATSQPVDFTNLIGENPQAAQTQSTYLSIPDNLAQGIREKAEIFIHEPNLTKRLTALRSYLQDNYRYSLKTTNTTNSNPVENFLYQEKRGHCEHFATAAALICRALGVPSRIAYGWSGGILYREQNLFVYRAKDAHAWTEIKLDGYGWVVFDTTPSDIDAAPIARSAPAGATPPNPAQATAATNSKETPQNALVLNTHNKDFTLNRLVIALTFLGLCCLAFLVARYFKKPPPDIYGKSLRAPTPGYMLSFKQACSALGKPMPNGHTLRQHIIALEVTGKPLTFASELLEYHYGVFYGDLMRNSSREKNLTKSIQRWYQSAAHK
jgi:hypothetical protein